MGFLSNISFESKEIPPRDQGEGISFFFSPIGRKEMKRNPDPPRMKRRGVKEIPPERR
jgi:hypothetical protein